ncbi:hypothetical protein P4050_00335 [Pseudomonas aeruginosa]|nr:hypothetical protein [Pseudomonas aeruginosa]
MDPSHAIILAAIIIVGGLWGGKLLYDYIQERRIKAALNDAAAYMQQTMQQAEQNSRRAKAEMQQRTAAEEEAREQRRAEQLAQVQAEQARVAQENASNHPSASSGGSNTIRILRRNPHRGRPNLVENY